MPYGVAMSCVDFERDDGRAKVDLTGTAFHVASAAEFAVRGFKGAGTTTASAGGKVYDLTGGGYCAWNAWAGAWDPINQRGGFDLQLEYDYDALVMTQSIGYAEQFQGYSSGTTGHWAGLQIVADGLPRGLELSGASSPL